MALKNRMKWIAYAFVVPALIIFTISVIYPVIENFRISFYSWNGLSPMNPVGLTNYIQLFRDPDFINALKNTLVWTVTTTVIGVLFGTIIGILCGLTDINTTVVRTAIFSSFGISATASGMIWLGVYQPDFGLMNAVLEALGLPSLARPWLGDPNRALIYVIIAYAWTQTGFSMIIAYGAISSIPQILYEAALIDGGNSWQITRFITLPLITNAIRLATFLTFLSSLKAFDLVFSMTGGGPIRSTEILGYFMYTDSFYYFKLGYGAASVIILLIAVFIIAIPVLLERSEKT